ncbi:MAG: Gfo/Idh/MocA family oxidoreductase [Thermoguttaceae bacterium]|nr:Gfo/Idh/MocA family oxidoreductase [Thermoguttaceae bacterium]
MSLNRSTRRDFLKMQGAGAISLAMFSTFAPRWQTYAADSPNERFKIGFVGCGGMGWSDARELAYFGDVVALCDVDRGRAEGFQHNSEITKKPNETQVVQDYRRVLERDDIEIIGIATPDHWHVKIAVEALLSGKHVFCQKPLTLTIAENQLIRKAVAKTGKTFLVGTQQRCDVDRFMKAAAIVRKGLLGQIKRVVVSLDEGPNLGPFPVAELPDPNRFDWNMFLGQAPEVEFRWERAQPTFRYWYDYSGGQLTDWGIHHTDCALWALGRDKHGAGPVEIDGRNVEHASEIDELGRPKYNDRFQTVTKFEIKTKFADGLELVVKSEPNSNGILFEGTEGRIFVNRGRLSGKPIEDGVLDKISHDDLVALNHNKPLEWTKENFFRCIREGGLPSSDAFSHTYSMNVCHLCAIAARLGRVIRWNPETETILGDDVAASFLSREQRKGFELPTVD